MIVSVAVMISVAQHLSQPINPMVIEEQDARTNQK